MLWCRRMIEKVIIPAAGLGTRLLSATKEQPKEMLPVFARDRGGNTCVKPLVQLIFEQLFDLGIRKFCFVVGRDKRALEDHFTPDTGFILELNRKGKSIQSDELAAFYSRVRDSTILWVNQPAPLGFGHALLQARSFISNESFLVHAGDTYIISNHSPTVHERLIEEHTKSLADATLTLQKVEDTRHYGVAEVTSQGQGGLLVTRVEEKPARPRTNLAIMPLYLFKPQIFDSLLQTTADRQGEVQLTDAIQGLIDSSNRVRAIELNADDVRLDIGTPETYWDALSISYQVSRQTSRL